MLPCERSQKSYSSCLTETLGPHLSLSLNQQTTALCQLCVCIYASVSLWLWSKKINSTRNYKILSWNRSNWRCFQKFMQNVYLKKLSMDFNSFLKKINLPSNFIFLQMVWNSLIFQEKLHSVLLYLKKQTHTKTIIFWFGCGGFIGWWYN